MDIPRDEKGEVQGLEYQLSGEHLLSDPEKMRRLQKINPNLVLWIMERSVREQQSRHNLNMSKLALIEGEQTRLFRVDVLTIFCAFFLMGVGMVLSYLLLSMGLTITGGVFAGSTIIFAALSFL